jgi:hypothetical protein
MKLGYGYKRRIAELEAVGAERVYIDGDNTNRVERRYLFRDLRKGDTLVLIAMGDLGAGKGLRNMRAELEDRGVDIVVATPPEDDQEPVQRGRPSAWLPTPEEDDRLRSLWTDVSVDGGYVIDLACAAMGQDKKDRKSRERVRHRLLRRYGKKSEK